MTWILPEAVFTKTNVLAFLLGLLLGIELGYWTYVFSELLK